MKKTYLSLIIVLLLTGASNTYAQCHLEDLNRGLVAVRTNPDQVYVAWRQFGNDPDAITFNVYRDGVRQNTSPIKKTTNYLDNTAVNGEYHIKPVINGKEQEPSESVGVWQQSYLQIPLQTPPGGTTPDGEAYTYTANDCSVGDLNGDGRYEVILKWDPTNSHDNAHNGYTGNVYLDAYTLEGNMLWRIDLGRNIRAGAHYTQFMVYDLDGDGKAEVACKTADATVDGRGNVIGDPNADYRSSVGRILEGPEFLTVFNGETGAAMATTDYVPARGNVGDWGDTYGNRVDRFLAGVAYLDGQRPSLVMCRGYYTRTVLAAWDWRNSQLTQRWVFDSDDPGNEGYAGQGCHSLSIADVDSDGKDEIVYGSMTVDDDGTGLYTTGLGHGDALHVSDLDPKRPGLEVFMPHENKVDGITFRDARTGEIIWQYKKDKDVGRGLAADIDSIHKGAEFWASSGLGVYNTKGEQVNTSRPSINHAIWWDDDLQRELLDGINISKYGVGTIFTAEGCSSNNSTKANPCLQADLFGDWREEVIFRTSDNSALRIYINPEMSTRKMYTLMHDPQYRVAIAWQNVAYNQPPHPSFYIGTGMETPPPSPMASNEQRRSGMPDLYENSEAAFASTDKISIYPNPAQDQIRVHISEFSEEKNEVRLYDFSGRLLNKYSFKGESYAISTQSLSPGIYIVKVRNKIGEITQKVVKN